MAPPTCLQKGERERDSVKATITFLENAVADHGTTPLLDEDVTHYLTMVSAAHDTIIKAHEAICVAAPPDMDPYNQEHIRLLRHVSALQRELRAIRRSIGVTPTSSSSSSTVTIRSSTGTADDIRLPKLELPTFNGNLQDWMPFRDIFTTTVHDNPKLSKAQKLTYLKTSLQGEAARQIKALTLTDANYDIAWTQITARYHNDRELLFSILHRFVGQHAVTGGSATSLRSLIDVSTECFRSLDVLKQPVDKWDSMLLYFMFQKLDSTSKELWEQTLKDSSIPALKDFIEFLEQRARALAARGTSTKTVKPDDNSSRKVKVHYATPSFICKMCSSTSHVLFQCPKFTPMSVQEKSDFIKKQSLCTNCLREGHSSPNCSNRKRCQTCGSKHHTQLHRTTTSKPAAETHEVHNTHLVLNHHSNEKLTLPQTILATALLHVQDQFGRLHTLRALLDGGSTASFITEACVSKLGLARSYIHANISGLASSSAGVSKSAASVLIQPHFPSQNSYIITCLLLPRVTGQLPIQRCDPASWTHLHGLQLADPHYYRPANIDMLIGSDLFWDILLEERRKGSPTSPIGLNSTLGWLVAGKIQPTTTTIAVHFAESTLDDQLRKFWEIESVPESRSLTKEEEMCEEHFNNNYRRDDVGRIMVKLPFKSNLPTAVGHSRDIAVRRLKSLERRFESQPETKKEYVEFMREYLALGHMEKISDVEIQSPVNPVCYIPHHFVRKDSSTTTKLRVVFDASAKTSTGISLNETMMVGPTIQDNLVSILMRFRTHVVAFTADVAKMYRQIRMDTPDTDMQRIVWREDPSKPIQDFRLLTVTYGTASAPYLATKALQQLAQDEETSFPLAAAVMMRDFYIDDVMSGGRDVNEALTIQQQLVQLTARGNMQLRKWSSNSSELLAALPVEMRETKTLLQIETDPTIKALGVYWNPADDIFLFKLAPERPGDSACLTKRMLLSEIAKIFDPLGWLAPVIIRAKILLQRLWALTLGWDEVLPAAIREEWDVFRSNLPSIEQLSIPRCILPNLSTTVNLCGFCDASERAYAAVVYLCVYFDEAPPQISLITSKTRVAPVKTVSLPRLELCGAVLLAQLMTTVDSSLQIKIHKKQAWTDSTVVLAWIQSHPSRWKTFVGNRVTEIQRQMPSDSWNHVSGTENPADCASRGIDPTELREHPLWWTAPTFLEDPEYQDTSYMAVECNLVLAEERKIVNNHHHISSSAPQPIYDATTLTAAATTPLQHNNTTFLENLFVKYGSFRTLRRVTAWILRFSFNCRINIPFAPRLGPLTAAELEAAAESLVKAVQTEIFSKEINCLRNEKLLSPRSSILALNPFLDSSGVLRVGGRLSNATISPDRKTPILLPGHHKFTSLLIRSLHIEHHHAGGDLLLSILRQKYWITRAKDSIRYQTKKCVVCTRQQGTTLQQMMGNLPADRVNPAAAFTKCGVDYAGPFLTKSIIKCSKVTLKAYLALFICFTTRAIHLEVVSDLSTPAFLAALKRFIARRGRPTDIYSDCGSNFVGAAREIKEIRELQTSSAHNNTVAYDLSSHGTQWHFNVPSGPHFGGLWEAGVKSTKFHLHRIMGAARLTFEELSTMTTQVEAILNSRPLTPMSTDASDLAALTPGHFLIGRPLTALPETDLRDEKTGRLNRWQLLQQLGQHFWNRWSNEYLSRLQQRPKWMRRRADISVGDLVLVKEDRLPPLDWRLGRVLTLHPGKDGLVRVVTLRTEKGELKRPIVKLCLLPLEKDDPEVSGNKSETQTTIDDSTKKSSSSSQSTS